MGYQEALEANGVIVKEYKLFGDYQGTWIALLEDGRFVEGSYGSCSGCDSFEAEFGWEDEFIQKHEDGKFYSKNYYWDKSREITEQEADKQNERVKEKLRSFGESYLNASETREEITNRFKKKCEEKWAWGEDKEILEWLLKV